MKRVNSPIRICTGLLVEVDIVVNARLMIEDARFEKAKLGWN